MGTRVIFVVMLLQGATCCKSGREKSASNNGTSKFSLVMLLMGVSLSRSDKSIGCSAAVYVATHKSRGAINFSE